MSVINNVLKDLESRSSQFTPIDIASVENLIAPKSKEAVSYVTILLIVAVFASFAFGLFLYQEARFETKNQINLASITPAPIIQQAQLPVEAVLALNRIIDLQIRESIDDMKLEFSLREKVVSYLKERTENSFIYHLKNIESEIVAPTISHNRWIEEFSLTAVDDGVDISFRTATRVLVETRQKLEDGKHIWSIKLKKMDMPIHRAEQIDSPVKKTARTPETKIKAVETAETRPVTISKATVEAPSEAKTVKLDITSSRDQLSASGQIEKAQVYIRNRRWSESETLLRRLIDGPQDLAARTLLLSIYQQREQAADFSVLVRESIEMYPQQALFITEYARLLFQLKAYTEVIELLRAQRDANSTQLSLLAASHQRLDRHLQATEYYQQSLEKNSREAKNWIGLGISQEQLTLFEAALQSYTTAARLGSLNSRLNSFVDKRINQLAGAAN